MLATVVVALLLWRWCRSKRRLLVQGQQQQVHAVEILHEEDRTADLEEGGVAAAPLTVTPNETRRQNLEERRQDLTRHGDTLQADQGEASAGEGAAQLSMGDASALHGAAGAARDKVVVAAHQDQLIGHLRAERVSGLAAEQIGGAELVSLDALAGRTEQDVGGLEHTLLEEQRKVSCGTVLRCCTLQQSHQLWYGIIARTQSRHVLYLVRIRAAIMMARPSRIMSKKKPCGSHSEPEVAATAPCYR